MPNCARRNAGICAKSMPSTLIRPAMSGRSPITLLSVVVLPAPLRPTSATRPPRGTTSETPRSTSAPWMATLRPARFNMTSDMAQHCSAHFGIGEHGGGLALGDNQSLVENQNALAVAEHDLHVVLDEDSRDPAAAEHAEERIHHLEFVLGADTSCRFIHEEQARPQRHRQRDVKQLPAAFGQLADAALGVWIEAKLRQYLQALVGPYRALERLPNADAAGASSEGQQHRL